MIYRLACCIFAAVAGESFTAGKKWRGMATLIAFAALPFLSIIIYSFLADFVTSGIGRYLLPLIFVTIFSIFWAFGKERSIKLCLGSEAKPMPLGGVCASIIFWMLILAGWVFCVIYPLKNPGPGGVTIFSQTTHNPLPIFKFEENELTQGKGNVVFIGSVSDKSGQPVANHSMMLVFNNYTIGARIRTDADGNFSFRMPPGTWLFNGPYNGNSALELSHKEDDIALRKEFFVRAETSGSRVIKLDIKLQ